MPDEPLVLELRGISKSFGSVEALTDVDLEVHRGEIMALVGDNGAGKSTLIKAIAGIHGVDSGEIWFEGKRVSISGPKDAARLGIEVVYQDLALCDNLDVVQNMYLGREAHNVLQVLSEPVMEQRTATTLKSLAARERGYGLTDRVDGRHGQRLDPSARSHALGRPAPVGCGREGR